MNGSKREPHILILAPFFPPYKGAAASRLHSFAKYWSALTQVTVVAPEHVDKPTDYNRLVFPLAKWRLDFLRLPWTFPKLLTTVKRFAPDIVIVSIPPVWPLEEGYLLGKRLGCPLILDVRDLPTADSRTKSSSVPRRILRSLTINISRYLGQKAVRVTTVTDWCKEELTAFLGFSPRQVYVICNGSETSFSKKALSIKKEFDLVYSGTLISIRNPAGLLKYLRFLAGLYPSLHALFISNLDNPIGREFLEGIDRLGLRKNVFIEFPHPPEKLPGLLGRARLGLNTLLGDCPAYRGAIGAKEYEYLAAGLPVMGLMDPDYYIESGKLIVVNNVGIMDQDPKRLAAETAALLKDSVRLRRMSKRARKVGERFDRKRLAEEYYYKVILPAWKEFNATR